LADNLAAAFDRFMIDPEESDNLCRAKVAIVDALNAIDYPHEDVFLRGVQHVQTAGVWNDPIAIPIQRPAPRRLRLGTGPHQISQRARSSRRSALDKAKVARRGAARALGASGLLAAVPLLRFKARIGDDPAVTGECLTGLMQLAPEESLPFLAEFLRSIQPGVVGRRHLRPGRLAPPRCTGALEGPLAPGPQWSHSGSPAGGDGHHAHARRPRFPPGNYCQ